MNLNQVTVPSLNVEKAIQFYEKLGLRLIVKNLPHYVRFECLDGDSTISIHEVESLAIGEGTSVYFEVDDVAEKQKELEDKGIRFDQSVKEQSWLWTEARLKDLDGNRIIIFHGGENRKNPPWRIN